MEPALDPGERGSGLRSPTRRLDLRASPNHPGHPPPVRPSTLPHPLPPFRGPHPHQGQDEPGHGHRSCGHPPPTGGRPSHLGQPGRPRHLPPPNLTPPTPSHPPVTPVGGPRTVVRVPSSVARAIFPSLKPGEASHLFWAGNVESSDPRISQFCRLLLNCDNDSPAVLKKSHPLPPQPLRRPAAGPDPISSPPGFPRGRSAVLREASDAGLRGTLPDTNPPVNILARQPTAGRRPFQAGATTAPQGDLPTPPSPAPAPSPDL